MAGIYVGQGCLLGLHGHGSTEPLAVGLGGRGVSCATWGHHRPVLILTTTTTKPNQPGPAPSRPCRRFLYSSSPRLPGVVKHPRCLPRHSLLAQPGLTNGDFMISKYSVHLIFSSYGVYTVHQPNQTKYFAPTSMSRSPLCIRNTNKDDVGSSSLVELRTHHVAMAIDRCIHG